MISFKIKGQSTGTF